MKTTHTGGRPATSPQEIHRLKAVLEYLSAIPAKHWCRGTFHRYATDRRPEQWCVHGHLDRRESPVFGVAREHFNRWLIQVHKLKLVRVNDGLGGGGPRDRVLRALRRVLRRIGGGP